MQVKILAGFSHQGEGIILITTCYARVGTFWSLTESLPCW